MCSAVEISIETIIKNTKNMKAKDKSIKKPGTLFKLYYMAN